VILEPAAVDRMAFLHGMLSTIKAIEYRITDLNRELASLRKQVTDALVEMGDDGK